MQNHEATPRISRRIAGAGSALLVLSALTIGEAPHASAAPSSVEGYVQAGDISSPEAAHTTKAEFKKLLRVLSPMLRSYYISVKQDALMPGTNIETLFINAPKESLAIPELSRPVEEGYALHGKGTTTNFYIAGEGDESTVGDFGAPTAVDPKSPITGYDIEVIRNKDYASLKRLRVIFDKTQNLTLVYAYNGDTKMWYTNDDTIEIYGTTKAESRAGIAEVVQSFEFVE
jgi:hypothetical protein